MWIVRLALSRPYTFVVAAVLVVIAGVASILRMATDVFPDINIPVISVVYNYAGMSSDDMEARILTPFERFVITVVNDIDHIESQSLNGIGVVKIFFQKNAKVEEATAEVTATAQSALRLMPPGAQPPLIIRYSASSVPILQLAISSATLPEQQLFDITINQLRTQLITVPGVMIPYPYGGRQRQVMVDLDPDKLYAWGISAQEVSNAIGLQNLILPAGTAKIGDQEYPIRLNSSPDTATAINDMPIKSVRGTTVFVRDVANVRDGFQVQTNVVHAGGRRGVLLSILKLGNASTLDVVDAIKRVLPEAKKQLPPDLDIDLLIDQSVFVRASVEGVVKEAAIAAFLTGLMILLFLGSWRSTLIVVVSIPLSILVAIVVLWALGETLNVMTLGGLALAVGILVDDATVAIENIHRNLHERKPLVRAILDGAQQIAVPSFVATLCICIVFVPVAFISGAAKYLFTPLALAVVFAMLTSYLLSRTLLPTMVHFLLPAELAGRAARAPRGGRSLLLGVGVGVGLLAFAVLRSGGVAQALASSTADPVHAGAALAAVLAASALLILATRQGLFLRLHHAFQRGFDRMQRGYGRLLAYALGHRTATVAAVTGLVVSSCVLLLPLLGSDFFPTVDAGQMRLHVRAPAGTRIESTERWFAKVTDAIERRIPAEDLDAMLDNIGIPNSGINLSLSDGTLMSPADGEILISLKPGHRPTEHYVRLLRHELTREFPDLTFFFQPPDIVTQVLAFGLASPIDVQIAGPIKNEAANLALAEELLRSLRATPGLVDLHLQQVKQVPDLRVDVDRTLAERSGVSQRDVAQNLLIALSGTLQAAPNFWMNPVNGVTYSVIVQVPQYRIDSLEDLQNLPIQRPPDGRSPTQLLGNLASTTRGTSSTNFTHYNIQRTVDVLMNVDGIDLGTAGDAVRAAVEKVRAKLPQGSSITLRGQVESMRTSFTGLATGLLFAILLVYLLMVVNFQSWLDPLIILMALPGAAAGILWVLFATRTTLSVPALMGAIMAVGVATANSILVVTFANDHRRETGASALAGALAAGLGRLRPVLMTALAMIIGMLPMALGFGEGGEQNAPLGRAVIGGLVLATFTTLFFVPVCYSLLKRAAPRRHDLVEADAHPEPTNGHTPPLPQVIHGS